MAGRRIHTPVRVGHPRAVTTGGGTSNVGGGAARTAYVPCDVDRLRAPAHRNQCRRVKGFFRKEHRRGRRRVVANSTCSHWFSDATFEIASRVTNNLNRQLKPHVIALFSYAESVHVGQTNDGFFFSFFYVNFFFWTRRFLFVVNVFRSIVFTRV